MSLTPINPPTAVWPGLSQGMLIEGRGMFVSSGHVGVGTDGEIVTSSLEDQITALFEGLGRTLGAAGLDFTHVARITTYVTDYDAEILDTFRRVRVRYINADAPPASVLVGISALYDPRLRVECEIIAVMPHGAVVSA